MGRLFKTFADGDVKRCHGAVFGHQTTTGADRFSIVIKFEGRAEDGFGGYRLNISYAEARALKRKLDNYLEETSAVPQPKTGSDGNG